MPVVQAGLPGMAGVVKSVTGMVTAPGTGCQRHRRVGVEIGLIATLQAFIFATLTSIYLGGATAAEGH